jgi:integrase/recombinase XerC
MTAPATSCARNCPEAIGSAWPDFWTTIKSHLRGKGYRQSTLIFYRQVLRKLAKHSRTAPHNITKRHITDYLYSLANHCVSASWLAMNISVLRTCFDKTFGTQLLADRTGPKRPKVLPVILSRSETQQLVSAADNPRDGLAIALLYGCGLKPGELVLLRWQDFDMANAELAIPGPRPRTVRIPQGIKKIIEMGQARCAPTDFVFAGRYSNTHLSVRTIDRIVRTTAQFAGILKPVTAMTLRHSYAVHQLQAGINIREIQQHLGLRSLETMMRYLDCIPEPIPSPFDSFTVPLIPDLPTEDIQLPFPQTSPTRYFYRWMTTKLKNGFRLFRSSA